MNHFKLLIHILAKLLSMKIECLMILLEDKAEWSLRICDTKEGEGQGGLEEARKGRGMSSGLIFGKYILGKHAQGCKGEPGNEEEVHFCYSCFTFLRRNAS